MYGFIRTLYRPAWYHGHHKRKNFFEGWFFKVADADGENIFSFIPGIFLGEDESTSHSFIQIMDGMTADTDYHRLPVSAFFAAEKRFEIGVGTSRFTGESIALSIASDTYRVEGILHFRDIITWPVTFRSPGIMGWYSYIPFMECNHGVVSLDHTIEGALTINDRPIDFTGGRGYIEKDWGKSFPEAWIWIQTNHFGRERTSLVASVAKIPWLFSSFRGFIIGFLLEGKLFRFATYTGARLREVRLDETYVEITAEERKHRLEIRTRRGKTGMLFSPHRVDMMERTAESLQAVTEVRLIEKTGYRSTTIFEGTGIHSGLDINGKIGEIVDIHVR
jgi:tocopherol cyclase